MKKAIAEWYGKYKQNSMYEENIVFLFSLPRSGSTLVQRILSENIKVQSTAESWFLLSLFHPLARKQAYTEYHYPLLRKAIKNLYSYLPNGKDDYLLASKGMALSIYNRLISEDNQIILEKTPRYHLIVNELMETFPKAKFIFLWRNPLSIHNSIAKTWGKGYWINDSYRVDMYDGLINLIQASQAHNENIYQLNYEKLVDKPYTEVEQLCKFLQINYSEDMIIKGLHKKFENFGDQVGVHKYKTVSVNSIDDWQKHVKNPLRKRLLKNYLKEIGKERINYIGYDYEDLIFQLEKTNVGSTYFVRDCILHLKGIVKNHIKRVLFS